MVIIMNKKGVTLLELIISISLIAVFSLLLIKIIFSLGNINNNPNFASNDEISRATIVKTIESDFLKLKLQDIKIKQKEEETLVIFNYENTNKELIIKGNSLTYDNEVHTLESPNATYSLDIKYERLDLDENYYLINIELPVLINKENKSMNDDLVLTYIGLKQSNQETTN